MKRVCVCVRVCACVRICACTDLKFIIGRVSLARENETGGRWGQEVHILHVNI